MQRFGRTFALVCVLALGAAACGSSTSSGGGGSTSDADAGPSPQDSCNIIEQQDQQCITNDAYNQCLMCFMTCGDKCTVDKKCPPTFACSK